MSASCQVPCNWWCVHKTWPFNCLTPVFFSSHFFFLLVEYISRDIIEKSGLHSATYFIQEFLFFSYFGLISDYSESIEKYIKKIILIILQSLSEIGFQIKIYKKKFKFYINHLSSIIDIQNQRIFFYLKISQSSRRVLNSNPHCPIKSKNKILILSYLLSS